MVNADIRKYATTNGVRQWEIAEHMGVSESVLCRRLRHELSLEEKEKFIQTVDQVKNEGVVNG